VNICAKEANILEDPAAAVTIGVSEHICEFMKMGRKQRSTLVLGHEIMDSGECNC
jgi:hypothetical protein